MTQSVVYIGPTIEHTVTEGRVFGNGYPPRLKELIKKEPFISELFVPVSGLAEARKEIRTPGSRLNMLYTRTETTGGR